MGPFENDNTQGLRMEEPEQRIGLNPEMEIVLFGTRDVVTTSDPNAGTWIP